MISWNLYQKALLPYVPPYEEIDVDTKWLKAEIIKRRALFARWTSDFDCGYETEWWFCLRDKPIELEDFKSKTRNEINRGLRTTDYFPIENHDIESYIPKFYELSIKVFEEYPSKYRPNLTREGLKSAVSRTISRGGG